MKQSNVFRFGQQINIHRIGDINCPACRWDIPRVCEKCGEGIKHIELTHKKKGDIFLYHCDVCAGQGKNWREGQNPKSA